MAAIDDHVISLTWSEKSDASNNVAIGYGGEVAVISGETLKTVVLTVTAGYEGMTSSTDVSINIIADNMGYVSGELSYHNSTTTNTGAMMGVLLALTTTSDTETAVDYTASDTNGYYILEADPATYYIWHEYCVEPTSLNGDYFDLVPDLYLDGSAVNYAASSTPFNDGDEAWYTSVTLTAGSVVTMDFVLEGSSY